MTDASASDQADADPGELVTIAEAARALGIHEKRLRRLLQRPAYRDRTQTGTRTTATGARSVSLLSSFLVEEIRSTLAQENTDGDRDEDRDRTGTTTRDRPRPRSLESPELLREIIVRQDATINDLRETLARAQALHMATARQLESARQEITGLKAIEPTRPEPEPQHPNAPAAAQAPESSPPAPTTTQDTPAAPRRPWWMRFWDWGKE